MTRPVYISLIVAGLIFAPLSSRAADPEKVRELLDAMGVPKMIEATQSAYLPDLIRNLTALEKQTHPHLPPDASEIVSEITKDIVKPLLPASIAMTQKIFTDTLTDQEAEAAAAFYRTPTGQTVARQMSSAYLSGQPPTLTEDELDAASAFYSWPIGQSLNTKLPRMMQQLDQLTRTWVSQHAGDFDRRFDQALHKRHPEIK